MNCRFCCPKKSEENDAKRQSFSDQLDHIRIEHLGVYKPYKCDKCNASCSTETAFITHNLHQHSSESTEIEIMIPSKYLDAVGRMMMKCNMNKTFRQQQTVKQLIEVIKQSQPLPIIQATDQSPTQTIQTNVEQSVPMVASIMQNSQPMNEAKEVTISEIPTTTSNLSPEASINDRRTSLGKRSLMDEIDSFHAAGTNSEHWGPSRQPYGYVMGQLVQPGAEVFVRNGDHYVRCMYMGLSSETNTNNDLSRCSFCFKSFTSEQELQQHKTQEHQLICQLCGFVSVSRFGLRVHVRKHGALASVCPHCNQVCKTGTEFDTHLFNHTGQSVVVCTVCKRIEAHGDLFQEQQQHAGGTYRCKSCAEYIKK